LNGEEYLIVHHEAIYEEIREVIHSIDAEKFRSKVSKEKTMRGKMLYSPTELNKEFERLFNQRSWEEKRYYYIKL